MCHYILSFKMKIILDYEDGLILHKTRSWYYKILERIMLNISKDVLLVNKSLSNRLGNDINYIVVNGGFNISNDCLYLTILKGRGDIIVVYR